MSALERGDRPVRSMSAARHGIVSVIQAPLPQLDCLIPFHTRFEAQTLPGELHDPLLVHACSRPYVSWAWFLRVQIKTGDMSSQMFRCHNWHPQARASKKTWSCLGSPIQQGPLQCRAPKREHNFSSHKPSLIPTHLYMPGISRQTTMFFVSAAFRASLISS